MKDYYKLLLAILLLTSCVNKQTEMAISVTSNFEVLNDNILTRFPGGVYLLTESVVWFDPFTSTQFLHSLDKDNGVEMYSFGDIGQGPNEFVSPMVSNVVWDDCLYVYDANGNSNGYFSIERLKESDNAFVKPSPEDSVIRSLGYNTRLENELYLGINRDNVIAPYKLYYDGKEMNFGEFLLPNERKHSNVIILYNPVKKLLVTAGTAVEYFGCYKKGEDNFSLIWENRENYKYDIYDGRVVFEQSKRGVYGMAITKDFIVTIQRDYEHDSTDESKVGQDISKLPKTLFVYDYNGNLLKKIDYNVPIGRIAGDINTNTIYAIYADPDFKLGKSLIN